ncbi:MAG TPA: outer membrane beta-barrel protein [Candidatus Acidoferrales bacterium]|nr:outer membrane beta-barrel protein [Candidatus Acidoferrales bacterium]
MKKLSIIGCMVVVILSAWSSAKADDFKGFYAGFTSGGSIGRSHAQTNAADPAGFYFLPSDVTAIASTGSQHVNPTGFSGGVDVGYDMHVSKLIVGVEADYSLMSVSDSKTGTTVYPCCSPTTFTITQSVSSNWLFTARPRVGITMGHMLLFVTGGFAETHVRYNEHFTDTFDSATETAVARRNMPGWTVGGGVEYSVGRHFSVKEEYLYAAFGTLRTTSTNLMVGSPPAPSPQNVFTLSDNLHAHVVRAALNYRF